MNWNKWFRYRPKAIATDAMECASGSRRGSRLELDELERRILMSASPLGLFEAEWSDGADSTPTDAPVTADHLLASLDGLSDQIDATLSEDGLDFVFAASMPSDDTATGELQERSSEVLEREPLEVVFIDADLPDGDQLLSALNATDVPQRIVLLDPEVDGVSQISAYLESQSGRVRSVHVLTHGDEGRLQLGNTVLDSSNVDHYGAPLRAWGSQLAADADILFYGCDVAGTPAGQTLLERIAEWTQADVAASDDPTGAAGRGGNWTLEFQKGRIETEMPFQLAAVLDWNHVLDLTADGSEELLNSVTTNAQDLTTYGGGNISVNSSGQYAVVWNDYRNGHSDTYVRIFDSDGSTLVSEFRVHGASSAEQDWSNVAMADNGNVVVTWSDNRLLNYEVYARVFDIDGNPITGEMLVSSGLGVQDAHAVDVASDGSFVVVFQSSLDSNIYLQRYSSSGSASGFNQLVNSGTSYTQDHPDVSVFNDGSFVVTWMSQNHDGSDYGIYAQRYSSSGSKVGGEFLVNQTTTGDQYYATVANDSSGNFVIAWTSNDGDGLGVFARRFASDGTALSDEFLVNTYQAGSQELPFVAMGDNGDFVVGWTDASGKDGSATGVFAQQFDSQGTRIGGEVQIAETTSNAQRDVSVAYQGDKAVFVWEGEGSGDSAGVFRRTFSTTNYSSLTVDTNNDTVDGDVSSIAALLEDRGADGVISLREAILATNSSANGTGGADRILFGIASGQQTITIATTDLPTISQAIYIDGSSQTGFASAPLISLVDGDARNYGVRLGSGSDGSYVKAINLQGFQTAGIEIQSYGNTLAGNWIGTSSSGTSVSANGIGVLISGGDGNFIGGCTAADRNVISGNSGDGIQVTASADSNMVFGNYIGVDSTGLNALANGAAGIRINLSSSNQVGDGTAGGRNTISGNVGAGIHIDNSFGTVVQGNYVGLAADGDSAIGNLTGIYLANGSSSSLIGTDGNGMDDVTEINVISGNQYGIRIDGVGTTGNGVYGNYIGTDATGVLARGNAVDGVLIQNGATSNSIGGALAGTGNIIAANGGDGIHVSGETSDANVILNNWIGLAADGMTLLGNAGNGIQVSGGADDTVIGTGAAGNVIVGSGGHGIAINGDSTGTLIHGNFIGTDVTSSVSGGQQGAGVFLAGGASDTEIGGSPADGNTITLSGLGGITDAGVAIAADAGTGHRIIGNSIYENSGLGIDLQSDGITPNDANDADAGPNLLQNFPIISQAVTDGSGVVTISGSLQTAASLAGILIHFYASPSGSEREGKVYLGATSVNTDGSGLASFNNVVLAGTVVAGDMVTATATYSNNTSEFSQALQVSYINAAPVVSPIAPEISLTEDDAPVVTTIADFLGTSVTDANGTDPEGIAVTGVTIDGGTLEYSLDGIVWNTLGTVNNTQSLLLRATDLLRLTPNGIDGGQTQVIYHAWDQTTGTAGSKVDTSTTGGTTAFSDSSDVLTFDVESLNDAPIHSFPSSLTVTEETETSLPGISVADVDASGALLTTRLEVTAGLLKVTLQGGAIISVGSNNSSAFTLLGDLADINATLATLTYRGNIDIAGNNADTLTITSNDLGNTGTGGSQQDVDSVSIHITNINDEEVLLVNDGLSVDEGSSLNVISAAELETTDVDHTAGSLVYTLDSDVGTGELRRGASILGVGSTFTQQDLNDGIVTYSHDGSETFTDGFDFTVDDGMGTTTSASFVITIDSVNDQSPIIQSDGGGGIATLSIDENTTAVTTVFALDPDFPSLPINYLVVGGADGGLFTIDLWSGVLQLLSPLDRENPTDNDGDGIYEVQVLATDGLLSDTQLIQVSINDIDEFDLSTLLDLDNTANFVMENADVGTTVGLSLFGDDLDATELVTYSLVDDAGGAFQIDSATGVVTTLGAIDRESGAVKTIQVRATSDDGSFVLQQYDIQIGDVDEFDVTLAIDVDAANNEIDENSAAGTTVGILASALDQDATNNLISYILTDDDGGRFQIDSLTGRVTSTVPLDRETDGPTRSITVRAISIDGSISDQEFTITINDLDEFDVLPAVDLDGGVNVVSENMPPGTLVGLIGQGVDGDATNNLVTYSLVDSDAGRFQIDGNTGVVSTAVTLDRESLSGTRSIVVRSTSIDGSFSDATFQISLLDIDEFDVSPVVDLDSAGETVGEDAVVGAMVGLTAAAIDADATWNTVTYSLVSDSFGLFAIESTTGVVTVAGGLDYESASSHWITVRATSVDGSWSDTSWQIMVTDVNEFPVSGSVDVDASPNQVGEHATFGTTVGITASASDGDLLDIVLYSLADSAEGRFSIDPLTGVVFVVGGLDYEVANQHGITVRAISLDGSWSETDFLIQVLDDNDAPVDVSLGPSSIGEHASVGQVIGTLSTDDQDSWDSHTYQILGGSGQDVFRVQGNQLLIDQPLDHETNAGYSLLVRSTDLAGSWVDRWLSISVIDQNDLPTAGDDQYVGWEDQTLYGNVVWGSDQDADGDALTAYLVNGPKHASNFQLNLDGSFQYVPVANFDGSDQFQYRVYDGRGFSNLATVQIDLLPINDAPVSSEDSYLIKQADQLQVLVNGVLANDWDAESDPLVALLIESPQHGSLQFQSDGTFVYRPDDSFFGIDEFRYLASDGLATGNVVKVQILIQGLNAPDSDSQSDSPTSDNSEADSWETTDSDQPDGEGIAGWDAHSSPLQTIDARILNRATGHSPSHHPLMADDFYRLTMAEPERDEVISDLGDLPTHRDAARALIQLSQWESLVDDAQRLELEHDLREQDTISVAFDANRLWSYVQAQGGATHTSEQFTQMIFENSLVTGSIFATAGYVLWTLRGGVLVATMMTSLPGWRFVDPLPVLDSFESDSEEDSESIHSMLEEANKEA